MKILTVQNRMGIGDMVIFLPYIEAISKNFGVPVSLLVEENSKAIQFLGDNKNIDRMNNDLLHYGPFNESRKDLFAKLRTFLITLKPDNDKNIIITGHNSVMDTPIFHKDNIVDFNMEEGGFIVIKNLNGKLLAQHKFYLFSDFSKRLLTII